MKPDFKKVVRRKPVPFVPHPTDPKHLLYYVEEELECGHTVTVHPTGAETFTARKRSCYECTPWLNRPDLPEKLTGHVKKSLERHYKARRRAA
jgi:hypothetical protein